MLIFKTLFWVVGDTNSNPLYLYLYHAPVEAALLLPKGTENMLGQREQVSTPVVQVRSWEIQDCI